jgi:hypothetical protein
MRRRPLLSMRRSDAHRRPAAHTPRSTARSGHRPAAMVRSLDTLFGAVYSTACQNGTVCQIVTRQQRGRAP